MSNNKECVVESKRIKECKGEGIGAIGHERETTKGGRKIQTGKVSFQEDVIWEREHLLKKENKTWNQEEEV